MYDADPAKRFVFINMRKLREGESLPEGVRVDAITQTGAQLSYRGTQFSRRRELTLHAAAHASLRRNASACGFARSGAAAASQAR